MFLYMMFFSFWLQMIEFGDVEGDEREVHVNSASAH